MVSSDGGRGMAPGGCERCWCLVKVVLRQKLTELWVSQIECYRGRCLGQVPSFACRFLADIRSLPRMNPPMSSQTRRLPTTISKTKKVVYLGRPSTLLHLKMPCDIHLDHRHEVFLRYVSANARSTHCAEWSFYCSPERYNDRVAHWYVFDSVCRDRICDWKTAGCLVYWNDNILRIIQQKKQTFPQCSHEQLKSRPLPGAITAAKKAREIILEFGRGCGNNRVGFKWLMEHTAREGKKRKRNK